MKHFYLLALGSALALSATAGNVFSNKLIRPAVSRQTDELILQPRTAGVANEEGTNWSEYEYLGQATAYYDGLYTGTNPDCHVYMSYNTADPESRRYRVDNYLITNREDAEALPLTIMCYHGNLSVYFNPLPAIDILDEEGNPMVDEEGNPMQFYASDLMSATGMDAYLPYFSYRETPFRVEIPMGYHDDSNFYGYGVETIELNYEKAMTLPGHVTFGGTTGMGILDLGLSEALPSVSYVLEKGWGLNEEGVNLLTRLNNGEEGLMVMNQMAGNLLISPSEGPGRYTLAVSVKDLDGNFIGEGECAVYWMPVEEWAWANIGTGTLTEGFMPDVYGFDPMTYEVDVEESLQTPGLYRVQMFGPQTPYEYLERERVGTDPYYVYLDCTDPDYCYVYETSTGIILDPSGEPIVSSAPEVLKSYGYTLEMVKEYLPGGFGRLADRVLTFPGRALQVTAPVIDYYWLDTDSEGNFRLELPNEESAVNSIAPDSVGAERHFNLQGQPIPGPTGLCIKVQGGRAVKVVK